MKVLYQRQTSSPLDWIATTDAQWEKMAAVPVVAINVQGVVFEGADYYGVRAEGDAAVVAVWHDSQDWLPGARWAREVTFRPLAASPDPRLGGALTTRQEQRLYVDDEMRAIFDVAYGGRVPILPWSAFDPRAYRPLRGQWMSDALFTAHQERRSLRGWREWTEGVNPAEVVNGRVRDQRSLGRYDVPKGTRTFYHVPTAGSGVTSALTKNSLALAPTTATNQTSSSVGGTGVLVFEAVCPSTDPASSAWPTTGTYRYQMDVVLAGSDLVFGLLSLGSANGGFERVDAGVTSQLQRISQAEEKFSGSGLHLATVTNPAWSSGASSDRYGIVIAARRVVGHGTQSFTLQVGEYDDFTDGPWAAAGAAAPQVALMMGCVF